MRSKFEERLAAELRVRRLELEAELAATHRVQRIIDPRTRPRKKQPSAVGDRYDFSLGPRGDLKVAKNGG